MRHDDPSHTETRAQASRPARIPVRIDPDGTTHLPMFSVPLSRYMSNAARAAWIEHVDLPPALFTEPDVTRQRQLWNEHFYAPRLEEARRHFPVTVHTHWLGGVPVDTIQPAGGIPASNRHRVLINLHGGGFTFGAGMGGLLESIPIASLAGIKVISVDYRQGPEHRFPAASEDVAAVYRLLLTDYSPEAIGLYGCSAGGLLSAMVLAWLQRFGLPTPGAVALLCSPADDQFDGDSRYVTPPLMGHQPPLPHDIDLGMMAHYLAGTDSSSPLVSPLASVETLAAFPPTLLATGTRAGDLSSVVHSHAQLIKAGVEAHLHIWDGLWHGFMYDTQLPESRDLYEILSRFFNRYLATEEL